MISLADFQSLSIAKFNIFSSTTEVLQSDVVSKSTPVKRSKDYVLLIRCVTNPKTTHIKFLISRKFEVTIGGD